MITSIRFQAQATDKRQANRKSTSKIKKNPTYMGYAFPMAKTENDLTRPQNIVGLK